MVKLLFLQWVMSAHFFHSFVGKGVLAKVKEDKALKRIKTRDTNKQCKSTYEL